MHPFMPPTLFISAGEASGEAYGALLIDELKSRLAAQGGEVHFVGMGGPRMAAAGLERIVRAEDVAVMGITEVVRHLPRIYREFRKLKQSLCDRRPSVAILIDFPDIHFKLARECRRLGIPVVYFVSPQLWAWKKHRIKLVQRYVDRMLVIFPFEEPFYRERGVHAEFVGHPLAELPAPTISREDYARQALRIAADFWNYGPGPAGLGGGLPGNPAIRYELDLNKPWISILPGSRAHEIYRNLRPMIGATRLLGDSYEYLIPMAPTLSTEQISGIQAELADMVPEDLVHSVHLVTDARAALFHARVSIVASGTATVEAALIGNPFVVVYRVSPLTYAIARRVVTVPHVAMVNLIAQKRVIPELIQNDFTASNIVSQLQPLLPDGAPRQSMMKELAELRGTLRARPKSAAQPSAGAIARVAEVVLELLGRTQRTGAAPTAAPEPH
jgi:lipid-A-disaccharide synthase